MEKIQVCNKNTEERQQLIDDILKKDERLGLSDELKGLQDDTLVTLRNLNRTVNVWFIKRFETIKDYKLFLKG